MHIFDPLPREFLDLGLIIWYKYSVMILLGMIAAALLGIREGKKIGITATQIIDGIIIIIPLSIIGTRLWYVMFEWDQYKNDLVRILQISDGGLAIHGGVITAFVSVYFYTKFKKIDFLRAFDLVAPGFLIAQAFGRWGNFFNQEAHGGVIGGVESGSPVLSLDNQRAFLTETLHLPDYITNNMYLYGPDGLNYYHPTFLYESAWNLAGFILLLILRRTKIIRTGDLLPIYLIWYSTGRFFIEAMRTDSLYIGNTGLRTAQITSLVLIAGGIAFMLFNHFVLKTKHYYKALEENAL
ncbi:MAG: prolipoprotein diacylglyceryl transferase [Candidatus Izimaplasma sp.]|nr:prolipoprotein diacylglyceryl transferase [Candidatus Izimaplasma bacterium]